MHHKFNESLTNSNQWNSFSSHIDASDISFLYSKTAPIFEQFIREGSFKPDELMIKKNGNFNANNLVIAINPYKTDKNFFVSHLNMTMVDNNILPLSLSISKELKNLNILPWVDNELAKNCFGGLKVLLNTHYEVEGYQSCFSFHLKSLYSISVIVLILSDGTIRVDIKLVNNTLTEENEEKETHTMTFDNCTTDKASSIIYYINFINKVKDRKSERGVFYNGLIEKLPQNYREIDEQLNFFDSIDQDTIKRAMLLSDMIHLS